MRSVASQWQPLLQHSAFENCFKAINHETSNVIYVCNFFLVLISTKVLPTFFSFYECLFPIMWAK